MPAASFTTPRDPPVATISVVSPVRDISWQDGSGNITVTTDSRVYDITYYYARFEITYILLQVFLYPLETCSDVTTCEECTGEGSFPLCGWCTVENKCSRRSQCRDSTEERRWVDSSDQCIITSVTPRQFILETPTTVSTDLSSTFILLFRISLTLACVFPLLVECDSHS